METGSQYRIYSVANHALSPKRVTDPINGKDWLIDWLTSLLSEVMAHFGISGGFSSDHSHARFLVYGVFDWGVGVSWYPSIRLLALCERNQAVTGGFPSLKASNAGLSYFFVMMCYGSS